jgi:S1-C subfamily serine protease
VFHDLTLLQIDGPPVPALPLGDSDRVKEGQELAFMGFPIGGVLGFSSVTHRAMVSSITQARLPSAQSGQLNERAIRGLREGNFQIFQLDATAYPGNSGGPLFDTASGEVVGVLNMVLLKGARESALSQPSGISYAIPARHVREMMARQRN